MGPFHWGDLLFFLELVRCGNHKTASQRLKVDHTTVRRRVASLESALQTKLFSGKGNDQQLTAEGESLLRYAESIENLIEQAVEEVAGSDLAVSGTVRIGSPEGFGAYFLTPQLAEFCGKHHNLNVKLIILPRTLNLSSSEAEIAIGFERPSQLRQISRKLMDFRLSLFASHDYLKNSSPIYSFDDLSSHRIVSYVDEIISDNENEYIHKLSEHSHTDRRFQSTSISAQKEAIRSGFGIGLLPDFMVKPEDGLAKPLGDEYSINREFWLNINPEMINLARVRLVIDFIVEATQREAKIFLGVSDQG